MPWPGNSEINIWHLSHCNLCYHANNRIKLDGSLPANPANGQRVANAVTLKSTFRLP